MLDTDIQSIKNFDSKHHVYLKVVGSKGKQHLEAEHVSWLGRIFMKFGWHSASMTKVIKYLENNSAVVPADFNDVLKTKLNKKIKKYCKNHHLAMSDRLKKLFEHDSDNAIINLDMSSFNHFNDLYNRLFTHQGHLYNNIIFYDEKIESRRRVKLLSDQQIKECYDHNLLSAITKYLTKKQVQTLINAIDFSTITQDQYNSLFQIRERYSLLSSDQMNACWQFHLPDIFEFLTKEQFKDIDTKKLDKSNHIYPIFVTYKRYPELSAEQLKDCWHLLHDNFKDKISPPVRKQVESLVS